jgi:signal transduction histidine kinase
LASALRRGDSETNEKAMAQAIEDIELEIANLRAIITDLRPSLLDDLGLLPALEALLDRRRQAGLEITAEFELDDQTERPLAPRLETTIYRVVQEALTNVVKHAHAQAVRVLVHAGDGVVLIEVQDDGRGFDTKSHSDGFGLAGIRERVYLAGGSLELHSGGQGTLVRARLPIRPAEESPQSAADQMTG